MLWSRSLKTPGISTCCQTALWGLAHAAASGGWGGSGSWTEIKEVRTACLLSYNKSEVLGARL